MKVQVPMWFHASDSELQFYREMGIRYVSVLFGKDDWDYDHVCQETGVKMALHPIDPPVACVQGVSSLIYDTECFKTAFEMAENSLYLRNEILYRVLVGIRRCFWKFDGRHSIFYSVR